MNPLHDLFRGAKRSFLAGYLEGVRMYAVWKDGDQLVGAMRKSFHEVAKEVMDIWEEVGDHEDEETGDTKQQGTVYSSGAGVDNNSLD